MSTAEALAAINKTIIVEASQETAFETFTRQATSWWPKSHTIFEDKVAEIVFDERVGGRVYERSTEGEEVRLGGRPRLGAARPVPRCAGA